ncbi:MAG: gamma-glutamyl-gamma-aminobutyrate hydrolase family protein [Propionibacteriaceae bacterium]
MSRPVIGMSTGRMAVDYGPVPQYPLTYVPVDYVEAMLEAGGLPMPLALHEVGLYEGAVAEQLAHCDGLLLSGGVDISPAMYGEQPHPDLNATTPDRDAHELALLAEARRRGIPVLAICRGIQLVNVAYGGTLYQDIPSQVPAAIQHAQRSARHLPSHDVTVTEPSRLYGLVGGSLAVTSFHHQAIKDLGADLDVVATAPDGIIEAVEATDHPWLVAVQWHPEMSHGADAASKAIFDAFVRQCAGE